MNELERILNRMRNENVSEESPVASANLPNKKLGITISRCRCCLSNRGEIDVFETYVDNFQLSYVITYCTNEQISKIDGLSSKLCDLCLKKFTEIYTFIKKFKDIQKNLYRLRDSLKKVHANTSNSLISDNIQSNEQVDLKNFDRKSLGVIMQSPDVPFKTKYRKLGPIFKELCEILVKNKRQLLRPDPDTVKPRNRKKVRFCQQEIIGGELRNQSLPSETNGNNIEYNADIPNLLENRNGEKKNNSNCLKDYQQVVNDLEPYLEINIPVDVNIDSISKISEGNSERIDPCIDETTNNKNLPSEPELVEKCLPTESYKRIEADQILDYEVYTLPPDLSSENLKKVVTSGLNSILADQEEDPNLSSPEPAPQCFDCLLTFETMTHLMRHSKETGHDIPPRFKCSICSKTFKLKRTYKAHMIIHSSEPSSTICEVCGTRILANNFKRHMRIHEGGYMCPTCGKTFSQKANLQDHINREHMKLALPKKELCHLCGFLAQSTSVLIHHMNRKHKESMTHQCEECDTWFFSEKSLYFHISRKHKNPNKSRRYKNDRLPRQSSHPMGLTPKEKRIRYSNRPIRCTICFKMICASALQNHMNIHKSLKPYKCNLCHREFRQKTHLKSHMNIHLGIKPFKCVHCEKSFRHQTTLIIHARSHTGEKPYICEVCNKGFPHSSSMKKHMEIHFKRTPYKRQLTKTPVSSSSSDDCSDESDESS